MKTFATGYLSNMMEGEVDIFQAILVTSPLVVFAPFICCGMCYYYHFSRRKTNFQLRKPTDRPIEAHQEDWRDSLFRPEASAVVVIYALLIGLSFAYFEFHKALPLNSAMNFSFTIYPLSFFLLFLILDFSMYSVHYAQHFNRWLYHRTHATHHKIRTPTILVALTGHWPDTFMLVLIPLHFTMCIVDHFFPANAITYGLFSFFSMVHLHCIHSEFLHSWDKYLHFFGLVNTYDHHVHHLRPRKNLAHFFVFIDKIFGTYESPKSCSELVFEHEKKEL